MFWVHLLIVIAFIVIGSRLGGIGIGLAGGAGVLVLAATGVHTDSTKAIPWSVIGIIMTVICAVAAMELAGGIDHLVHLTEKLLRKHPKHITFLAPVVTYLMALLCGTGHTAYSVIPVIVDVSKQHGVRPSRPLSIAVVASQVAVAASPISAATIALTTILEPIHVGYLQCLAIIIPTTFIGTLVGAAVAGHMGKELADDPVYKDRMAKGLVRDPGTGNADYKAPKGAVASLVTFLVTLILVVLYATFTSPEVGLVKDPPMGSSPAIMLMMLTCAVVVCLLARKPTSTITTQSTFRSGMSAAISIMGLAWLGNTFVTAYMDTIKSALQGPLQAQPWLLGVFFYLAAPLMFSHAATTAAFMPLMVKLGLPAVALVACYPAVANYYLLPNYPTTVAAIEMDDTGSTRAGKFPLNHPFVIPGTVSIIVTIILGFLLAPLVL